MQGENRVAWREGLFLRPQHFQQQDRHTDALIRARTAPLRPYPWGLTELKINLDLAALGKFATELCSGLLPDGQPFSAPTDAPPPPAMDIPSDTRNAVVYLTLPARQSGSVEFRARDLSDEATRFVVEEEESQDSFSEDRTREPIETAKPNLRFGVTRDQTYGRICLPLARIREVQNGQLTFDDRFIPSCLDIRASARLIGFLNDIIGRANQRVEELALRAVDNADGGSDSIGSFLLLQALNRWTPALTHLANLPSLHPERLYEAFASMAGELATMTRADRRPPPFPVYVHEDLQATFEPVIDLLQASLSAVFDKAAEQLRLQEHSPGSYTSVILDRGLYKTGHFFLAVKAAVPIDDVRARFPGVTKIGAGEKMLQIIGAALPGVPLRHVPTPPPQIRILPSYVYFELDRGVPEWRDFETATNLGLHVAGNWPELRLELWCVKRTPR